MDKCDKIGIFDSGIGGATVLKEILKILPKEEFIYYSDSKNNPYGNKSREEIIQISKNIVEYFIEEKCKIIIIACNTASAIAVETLRKEYPQMTFIAIEPAYKMIHDYVPQETTLVMATKGTIQSEKFNNLYNKYNNYKTYLLPCVGLADIIEQGRIKDINSYLEENLKQYKGKIKNVVLGCTHYPLIKKQIKDVLGEVKFFDGAHSLAIHLKKVLEQNNLLNEGSGEIQFIDSSKNKEKEKRFFEYLSYCLE